MPNQWTIVAASLLTAMMTGSCDQSGGGGAAAVDHPAIGHWQGTIASDNGRERYGAVRVDTTVRPLRVALMYFPAGANYSDCSTVSIGDETLTFQFSRGKFDLQFDLAVSADGTQLSGAITALKGNKSSIRGGTIQFIRMPRASDLPEAMTFSRSYSDDESGDYTLTITLAQAGNGQWVGIVDIPERSMEDLTLFDMSETEGVITGTIRIMGPPMVFTMNISEDRQRLTGSWGQSDIELPRID